MWCVPSFFKFYHGAIRFRSRFVLHKSTCTFPIKNYSCHMSCILSYSKYAVDVFHQTHMVVVTNANRQTISGRIRCMYWSGLVRARWRQSVSQYHTPFLFHRPSSRSPGCRVECTRRQTWRSIVVPSSSPATVIFYSFVMCLSVWWGSI